MLNRLVIFFTCSFIGYSIYACDDPVNQTLQHIKHDPVKLHKFVRDLPKGADLHLHLDGAVYAEALIKAGKGHGFCVDEQSLIVKQKASCKNMLSLKQIEENPNLFNKTVTAWSMKDFDFKHHDGHDYMFNTFHKFINLSQALRPKTLKDVAERASQNNVHYLEIMDTLDNNKSAELAADIKFTPDLEALYDKIVANKLFDLIKPTEDELDDVLAEFSKALGCGMIPAKKACRMPINFLYQVLREQPPQAVFAQLMFGFKLADTNPHVVGLNMVQPEDGPISMRDYRLHMQMVGFLKTKFPHVHVSLHAGEMNENLANLKDYNFHIHDAVTVAGANRIGHGVSIKDESNRQALLTYMRENEILVEINLTSNDQILGVSGIHHPLRSYMAHQIPVALSTDDEGVLRTNISREYERAILEHHLDYCELKQLSRNGLSYSFLPGKSLWQHHTLNNACSMHEITLNYPTRKCRKFLQQNTKARVQWQLEQAFLSFETRYQKN